MAADDRTLRVRLLADIRSYQQGLRQAAQSTKDFGRELSGMGTAAKKDIEQVGRSSLLMAAGMATGLGLSAKAAIDWESSWTGVLKTVDGTSEQLNTLEGSLRDLATELPATHGEIAAVAEAAGALGVGVNDVEDFTRVMVGLGEATDDLSAVDAATALARLTNIMGTAGRDVERLGSTIVELGNSGASTEGEIVELATRLAAAGEIAGLSEADVLAFASTLSSVGVEAEAGGTALSKVFTSVRDAVLDGGDSLDTFAKTAGVSTAEFADAFRQDAAGAIALFIDGLGEMNDAGRSTTSVFEDLELTDQRLMRSLLSTASAGDLLTDQLAMASNAWEENTALQTEAEKRYATTAAQMEILRNKVGDLAIDAGQVLLPAINATVGGLGNMADGLASLPGPLQVAGVGLTTLSTAGLGLIGAVGVVGPKVKEFKESLSGMGTGGAFAARNLGTLTAVLGGVGIAVGVGATVYELATRRAREYADMVKDLRKSFDAVIEGQSDLNDEMQDFIKLQGEGLSGSQIDVLNAMEVKYSEIEASIRSGGDALDPFREALTEMGHDLDGIDIGKIDNDGKGNRQARLLAESLGISSEALRDVINEIENWDDAWQDQAKSSIDAAVTAGKITAAQRDQAIATASAGRETENYVGAFDLLFPSTNKAADGVENVTGSIEDQTTAAERAAERLAELIDAYNGTFDPFLSMQDALASLEDAHDAVTDAQQAHADAQRGVADARRQATDDIAAAERDVIDSARDVEDAQLDVAAAMGIVADEAEAARQGIAGLAAEQQAAIDPLFAMVEAVQRLEDLRNSARSTVKGTKTGENSGKLESQDGKAPTPIELAQAAAGVQSAATRLAGAIRTGDVSLADSRKTLDLWVDQGLLTKEAAAEVAAQFETVAKRAEQLQGANVRNAASTAVAAAEMKAAEERAEAVADAQERLREAMDRSTDAQGRLARAHEEGGRRIADAQRNVERTARDVVRAQERVARVAADVMVASINLTGAMVNNRLAVKQAKDQWQELADQGIITQAEADRMKRKIDEATAAAERYAGNYEATLDLNTDKFWLEWLQVYNALDKKGMPQIGPDGKFQVKAATGFMGTVSRPTSFLIGEGGEPEDVLIVPHSKGGIRGGASSSDMYALARAAGSGAGSSSVTHISDQRQTHNDVRIVAADTPSTVEVQHTLRRLELMNA